MALDGHRSLSAGYLIAFQSESSNSFCVNYRNLCSDQCSVWLTETIEMRNAIRQIFPSATHVETLDLNSASNTKTIEQTVQLDSDQIVSRF